MVLSESANCVIEFLRVILSQNFLSLDFEERPGFDSTVFGRALYKGVFKRALVCCFPSSLQQTKVEQYQSC